MLTLLEGLRLASALSTGYMAGSALYISVVEVPSRDGLAARPMHHQWSQSFRLAAKSMMLSGLIAGAAPTAVYFLDENCPVRNLWLVGPACFLMGSIYTFGFIIPDVKVMLDKENIEKKGETWLTKSVDTWGKKHLLRTLINGTNFTCMILAIMWS
ncbi:hypothetical protein FSP39_005249 [Pinctada imbricata]|uniref:DUF1772 domain-containing protein n=1 Tax=Pinctada imbricata TaxID=66713 RepID=A0AA89BYS1_PINIB|nr:hypothetical protein FSP39_005249 [Pinctada imbricata]